MNADQGDAAVETETSSTRYAGAGRGLWGEITRGVSRTAVCGKIATYRKKRKLGGTSSIRRKYVRSRTGRMVSGEDAA